MSIKQKVNALNDLFLEVHAYKREHPDERIGYYPSSVASILNAYREGDIGFDDAIAAIQATKTGASPAPPSPVASEVSQPDPVSLSRLATREDAEAFIKTHLSSAEWKDEILTVSFEQEALIHALVENWTFEMETPASPVSAIETLVSRAAVLSAIDNYFAEMDAVYKPEHRGIARMTCQSIQIAVRALPSYPSLVSAEYLAGIEDAAKVTDALLDKCTCRASEAVGSEQGEWNAAARWLTDAGTKIRQLVPEGRPGNKGEQ